MSELSEEAMQALRSALVNFIDNGSQSASVILYEGDIPGGSNPYADDQKILAQLYLPKPSLKQAVSNYIELLPPGETMILRSGIATWAQLKNGEGKTIIKLLIGEDIELNKTEFAQGGILRLPTIKIYI